MIAEITENKGFAAFVQITVETFHRFVQIGNAPDVVIKRGYGFRIQIRCIQIKHIVGIRPIRPVLLHGQHIYEHRLPHVFQIGMAFFENHPRILHHFLTGNMPQVFAHRRGIAQILRLEHQIKAEMVICCLGIVVALGKWRECHAKITVFAQVADKTGLQMRYDRVKHAACQRAEIRGRNTRQKRKFRLPRCAAESMHAQR